MDPSAGPAVPTGRLTTTLGPRTRRIVYGEPDAAEIRRELDLTSTVDLAHLVMLAETGLLPKAAAVALATLIRRLRADGFAPLAALPAPRGLYLMYEGHLIGQLGADVGGRLHTGRSRNDVKATATAIRLRAEVGDLLSELGRLQAVLLARARMHRNVVMPVYTHFQPAMPIGYGYYLAGVAAALDRDLVALRHELAELRRCPLGAGAVAGSDLPLDTSRTAGLLGFAQPPLHAMDAVAARDSVLRAIAVAASVGLTLSRLATDLQLWSTQEFGFVEFPERLVGGSSAMPQKRNAFLLEHLRAKSAAAVGAWTGMAAATKSAPFTNSIEVGTEAVGLAWPAFAAVRDGVVLAQVLVAGARPDADRMAGRARESFVTATAVANRLVARGVPFRTAHHAVGAAVREAVAAGVTELTTIVVPDGAGGTTTVDVAAELPSLDAVVAAHRTGGGPGAVDEIVATLRRQLTAHAGWLAAHRDRLRCAAAELDAAIDSLTGGGAA